MTTYAWPEAWGANRFEMRVQPNERVFRSVFNPASAQVVDAGGDYWVASLSIPAGIYASKGAEVEAFLNRLRGSQNFLSLYHLRRPVPRGTMRDGVVATWFTTSSGTAVWSTVSAGTATWSAQDPVLASAVPQFATSATIACTPGKTLLAGDLIGIPNGQTVQVLADATANGSGFMAIEFAPSARSALEANSHVYWDRPAVSFRLRDGAAPPVTWRPGMYESITLDLVEAI